MFFSAARCTRRDRSSVFWVAFLVHQYGAKICRFCRILVESVCIDDVKKWEFAFKFCWTKNSFFYENRTKNSFICVVWDKKQSKLFFVHVWWKKTVFCPECNKKTVFGRALKNWNPQIKKRSRCNAPENWHTHVHMRCCLAANIFGYTINDNLIFCIIIQ